MAKTTFLILSFLNSCLKKADNNKNSIIKKVPTKYLEIKLLLKKNGVIMEIEEKKARVIQ